MGRTPVAATAAEQAQETEAKVAEQTPDPLAVAQQAVQSQLLSINYQNIPNSRIDAMVTDGLAFRYSKDPTYVYFATVVGDQIVRFILHEYTVMQQNTIYSRPTPPTPVGQAYGVVWQQTIELGGGARPVQDVLAAFNTQQWADRQIGDAYLAAKSSRRNQLLLGTINFVVHATPFLGTADYIAQGEYLEGFISAAGDAAMLLSFGASKVATTAVQARNLRIGAVAAEGLAGGARAGQGVYALKEGNNVQAAGYFGEAMLRFIGVSASTIKQLKNAAGTQSKFGAGGYWRTIDEVVDPTIVRQLTPNACGPACGVMLLRSKGVINVLQSNLAALKGEVASNAKSLAAAMNKLMPR